MGKIRGARDALGLDQREQNECYSSIYEENNLSQYSVRSALNSAEMALSAAAHVGSSISPRVLRTAGLTDPIYNIS